MSRTTTRTRVSSGALLALLCLAVAGPASAATTTPTTTPTASPTTSPTAATTSTSSTTSASTTVTSSSSTASTSSSASATTTKTAPATTRARSARVYGLTAATGPATSTDPAEVAGGYLARQLAASGGHFANEFGGVVYPDYGLTLDAVLALDAAGVGQDAARTATTYVADHVRSYVSGIDYGGADERYAGALAKTLNVAVAQQVDPTAFGGLDLVAELQAREAPTGRFEDAFDPDISVTDNSNTFSQSFAVLGLERAGAGASAQSVAFLRLQQCPAGGFRLAEADTACTDDASADPDSTSLAVQALIAAHGSSDASVVRGLNWLTDQQATSGGFGGGTSTEAVNANSTGLAGQALLAGGRSAPARRAVQYLTGLQYGCGFPAALRGGIAYNASSFSAQRAKGSGATPDDQDRRSSAQAALALAGAPLGVVTATGADANAPTLTCTGTPSSSTTTSSSSSTSTSSTTSGSGGSTTTGAAGGSVSSTTAAGSVVTGSQQAAVLPASESLPRTGIEVLPMALTALALILLGTVAVATTRRRSAKGAHA